RYVHPGRFAIKRGFGPPSSPSLTEVHATPMAAPALLKIGDPDMPPTISSLAFDIHNGPSGRCSTSHSNQLCSCSERLLRVLWCKHVTIIRHYADRLVT